MTVVNIGTLASGTSRAPQVACMHRQPPARALPASPLMRFSRRASDSSPACLTDGRLGGWITGQRVRAVTFSLHSQASKGTPSAEPSHTHRAALLHTSCLSPCVRPTRMPSARSRAACTRLMALTRGSACFLRRSVAKPVEGGRDRATELAESSSSRCCQTPDLSSRSDAGLSGRSDAGRSDARRSDARRSGAGRSGTGRSDACRSDACRLDACRSDGRLPLGRLRGERQSSSSSSRHNSSPSRHRSGSRFA